MSFEDIIRKWAEQNRLQYGKASRDSVLGRVLSDAPEAKKDIKALLVDIDRIVSEVNALSAGELASPDERKEKTPVSSLKLQGNPKNVVMRFAPNPNGPPTLGSARGIVVNSELVRKYGGKFILRFDDTDPKTKKPMMEAYGWYLEDCTWLDAKPDEVYYASERIPAYYEIAEKLIGMGCAYVCFCAQGAFKALKDAKKPCPERDVPPEKNLTLWKKMLGGEYADGECVLRIKTDITHKDPALRDWVAFRIIREDHPRVDRKYIVWPMLDFESAIEDKLLGVTHIIRGKDLADSEHRQKFIYNYLGWTYPATMHWGKVQLEEFGKFSTSKLKESIAKGEYSGWDDPRVPTIRAMRRRGIAPQAIRNLMIGLGLSDSEISISLENLFSENRKIMDPVASRYFFVEDPVVLVVSGAPAKAVKLALHPSFKDRGYREMKVSADKDGMMRLFISREDAKELAVGQKIRFMNLFNVMITDAGSAPSAEYLTDDSRDVHKIHWLPQEHLDATVVTPEGEINGFCELGCAVLDVGTVVQFERVGFVRLDKKVPLTFYFGHR
jgi:glutamyl-tRNA synthetase